MTTLSPLTLVLGGARSGKSVYAEGLIESCVIAKGEQATYIATSLPYDQEMAARIQVHKDRRGEGWYTVEEELDLIGALRSQPEGRAVLVDCLTLWLTNVMLSHRNVENEITALAGALAGALARCHGPVVLVSNEVGLGIVPDNLMAREFRDHAGRLNQAIAAVCQKVIFVAAGLPLIMKDQAE